jgi:hypothetical protein
MGVVSKALKKLNLQGYNFILQEFYEKENKSGKWVLDAPYQRGRLWSEEQNRNLIMSLLQGIPVGVIFANFRGWEDSSRYVVDGKQRISAIRDFVGGKLQVPSEWFEPADLESKDEMVSYEGLSERGKRGFDSLTVQVAESKLPDLQAEAKLYLLVNFGGVAQTDIDRERALELAQEEAEPSLIG